MEYITLTPETLAAEHICCAISDKKCTEGYRLKKEWLKGAYEQGYRFRRLDERAKVFIEYGPAEEAWVPVEAPGYLMLGCFWVSGRFKGEGHGKALLAGALDEAEKAGRHGLVAVAGKKKYHFMSDGKWLRRQGFILCDETPAGFQLLYLPLQHDFPEPRFSESVRSGECENRSGYTVYYTNRCPYTDFHIKTSLAETAANRGLSIKVVKLESRDEARRAPTPATIFSLFYDGRFVTTDLSVCMDSRFDKITGKKG